MLRFISIPLSVDMSGACALVQETEEGARVICRATVKSAGGSSRTSNSVI